MSADTAYRSQCFSLTGSIATGKSFVAHLLEGLGAHIVDTDLIAREVVEPGRPALREIAELFGGEALQQDGTLNRKWVREKIISDPAARAGLNDITHPRIQEIVRERIESFGCMKDGMPVIVDVPLLFETGWDRLFPRVILVYAPVPVQIRRLMERDGLDRSAAERTVAAQMDIEKKRSMALFVIDNSGSREETGRQAAALFAELLRLIREGGRQ
ncbi:MAG: dephospho-CoA kinase [Spirochaetes bacterium]|nr:dephospho-CoA kinase [Spirochaetota bacterium]